MSRDVKKNHLLIARVVTRFFGAGLIPWAPGTWGSLSGLMCFWFFQQILWKGYPLGIFLFFTLFGVGGWIAVIIDLRGRDNKDPGDIVIDEVLGQGLAALPLVEVSSHTLNHEVVLGGWLLSFVLFRVFDILKPWPVCWADKHIPGAGGVMIDDIIAGGMTSVFVLLYLLSF